MNITGCSSCSSTAPSPWGETSHMSLHFLLEENAFKTKSPVSSRLRLSSACFYFSPNFHSVLACNKSVRGCSFSARLRINLE